MKGLTSEPHGWQGMEHDELRKLLETNAAEIRRLKEAIDSTFPQSFVDAAGEAAWRRSRCLW